MFWLGPSTPNQQPSTNWSPEQARHPCRPRVLNPQPSATDNKTAEACLKHEFLRKTIGVSQMPLPEFNADGELPPGIHDASWSEVSQRFGAKAGQRELCTRRLAHV
jgi:hypothetical protein